jgi:ribulose-bisphosphate carboxylase large chain
VKTETPYARLLNALVYEVDQKNEMVKIAFPWRLFDRN